MHWHDDEQIVSAESKSSDNGCTAIVKRDKELAKNSRMRDFGWYCVKAFVLVAFLAFARDCSPVLPAWILPVIFLVYAVPATIGAMYDIVTNRLHKQDLYNEHGKLSHYNRRWFIWFGGFFVLYLVSALLFVLQAPSWDGKEWLLVWASPIVFYIAFLIIQHICKKEYDAKYYKARAIRWSIIAAALVLTILYVLISLQPPTGLQIDLHQIIKDRYLPYANSPAPFLAELDKLTTYAGCLTEYGISIISGTSYVVFIIVNVVLSFSVFAGVVSQLGACLLNREEVDSEFRLLPARYGEREAIQIKYFVILTALWIILAGLFVYANHIAGEIRSTDQYTATDQWINDSSEWAILVAEQNIETVKEDIELVDEANSFNELFVAKRDNFINEQLPKTIEEVNHYYDACVYSVDGYVDWYNSIPASASRFIPIVGENMVKDEFDKQIIDTASKEDIDSQYDIYLRGLEDLYDEYWNAKEISVLPHQAAVPSAIEVVERANIPSQPNLWIAWDSEEGKKIIQEVLLGKGADSEDTKSRILSYIEDQRKRTIRLVESMSIALFPSSALNPLE